MVDRFHVSGAQWKALQKLATLTEPSMMYYPIKMNALEGCYRRGLAGKIEDPSGVAKRGLDIRWFITPKGRLFLQTGEYVHDEETYNERRRDTGLP